jgi:lysophospholipase L1-like esterase
MPRPRPRRAVSLAALTLVALLAFAGVIVTTALSASAAPALPSSIAAIGDSITQAFDSCCLWGNHPSHSWSTGYDSGDGITSHYEHVLAANGGISGHYHNDAVTGSKMAAGPGQAASAVSQGAQYVTILLGANDVCTSSKSTMTSTTDFRNQFTSTMNTLQGLPSGAHVFVSSIPNIYQLWSVLHTRILAEAVWKVAGICQSMLSTSNSEADRQAVLAHEKELNGVLQTVCASYANCRFDNNAVFNTSFSSSQVSSLDYFHPNQSGQALLANITWAASYWG